MRTAQVVVSGVVTAFMLAIVFGGLASATSGGGTTPTLIGQATFSGFKVKRDGINDWRVEVDAKRGLDIATQTIRFDNGGYSGWHSHPGPVFIAVKEGTMTFYDHNCNATVLTAGEGFLDEGSDAHFARNESGAPALNVVTYSIPPHTLTLRIDQPQPANCPLQ